MCIRDSLTLDLAWSSVTDEGVSRIVKDLYLQTNLTDLSLGFEGCESLSDKSLHVIGDLLISQKGISKFEINLDYAENISDEAKRYFYQIGKSRKFSRFTLSFLTCGDTLM
eukprot:TRINITY_DN20128_c0_g1_i1.p1 TRINITY_DN20128_c0_g1~~TRINITY_DN20128_c0_g1_i1.p1  ORF type:complete len:130 (+),score=17.96 TRINITY_DN20128_c0_g1_i1:60-392(+)